MKWLPLLFLMAFALYSADSIAQSDTLSQSEEEVYTIVEQMPSFPGGEEELFKFLGSEIKYPKAAIKAKQGGVVYITFVISKDGSIKNARVLRGIGYGCDEEALRVVRKMPAWQPGIQRDKAVSVQYNLPIRFTYREEKKKG